MSQEPSDRNSKKLVSEKESIQDLINLAKSSQELIEITDVEAWITAHNVKSGNDEISTVMAYYIYNRWSKDPIRRWKFLREMNKHFKTIIDFKGVKRKGWMLDKIPFLSCFEREYVEYERKIFNQTKEHKAYYETEETEKNTETK